MDLSEKEKFGMEKRSGDHLNYQVSTLSAEWQFGNPAICHGNQMGSSPSISMAESLCPSLWNHRNSAQSVPIGKPVPIMASRPDLGGVLLPSGPNVLPSSLSHFPTDSGFIERAARFSCFNGNFSGMNPHPFSPPESLSPYSNSSRGSPGSQIQKSEINRDDQRDKGSLHSGRVVSNSESAEPDFSGIGQEEAPNFGNAAGDSSSRDLGAKKRKRPSEEMELEQVEGTQQLPKEAKEKAEPSSSTMAIAKPSGKQTKSSSEAPKEDYIHVRARRGQATNSHSLAERVRREKISERMKFLQDLVPGCSKVTGKAVMLDEIINYVQSLQRQVEFLSMKLAAVNPRLDINIEGLLSKDFLQPRDGSSSSIGFSLDMIHPQSHQQGLIPSGMSGMTYPSEALRRTLNAQLTMMNGYKEHTPQMPNSWDEEFHNVFQMNFGTTNPPLNSQELTGKPRDGFPM